jgi:hypothetical protein
VCVDEVALGRTLLGIKKNSAWNNVMSFGSADVSRKGKRGNNPFTSMRVEAMTSFSSERPL